MGHTAPGRLLGLMSEKRESRLGRLVYGRDPSAQSPVGRMFIQPWVKQQDGRVVRFDDAIGNRFAIVGWGADPTYGLTPQARSIWQALGGCFVMLKPETQMSFQADVPDDVIALGDVNGRLKDWFTSVQESVVILRPDRFVAALCAPQRVASSIEALANKLSMQNAGATVTAASLSSVLSAYAVTPMSTPAASNHESGTRAASNAAPSLTPAITATTGI
jgi:3-(3-hydroxy-phenyl)propionate hydroxylase